MNKLFIITFFVIGLQSDWLEETRRSIAEIDKHAVLMVTKVERDKDINEEDYALLKENFDRITEKTE